MKLSSAKFAPELAVKIVKNGRSRDFAALQDTWQAQEFVRVAKTLAGVVDLKRVRKDAFRVAGARISGFVTLHDV